MSKVRLVHHGAGFKQVLNDPAVRADLKSRGDRIAASAGDGVEVKEVDLNYGGNSRPGVVIFTATREAQLNEAENKSLTSALDAGR